MDITEGISTNAQRSRYPIGASTTVKMGETSRSEYSVNDTPDHSNDTTGGTETRGISKTKKESGMGEA